MAVILAYVLGYQAGHGDGEIQGRINQTADILRGVRRARAMDN